MRALLRTLLVLGLTVVSVGLWLWLKDDTYAHALRSRALATRGLAEYLAGKYPGQRALVISNPFTQQPGISKEIRAQEEAGQRGLREGFGNKVAVHAVVFPELKPGALTNPRALPIDAETTTPLSYLMAEEAFDKLVQANPGCQIIISLVGLPANLSRVELWQRPEGLKLGLLFPDLRIVGGKDAVRDAVLNGKLAAFVLPKPGAPPEQTPLGKDRVAEFAKRYILVTAENVEQVLQDYPKLFE